ncbi:DUF1793-domain-containing protein [Trametes sanguinea]|nr:DUF1793-domain-containing protein [Trametes sanguinea]
MLSPALWMILWCAIASVALVRAQPPVQTFFPAAYPLSIRSPHLSVWHPSSNGSNPMSDSWPNFWGLQSIMGWAGKIRVDNQTYSWMGQDQSPPSTANVSNVQVTPTRTIFTMQAGPMNVTITFLSPIEPSDWVLQSLPFSYVSCEATALDGQPHNVQVYSDISAEWLSGDRSSFVKWTTQSTSGSRFHEIDLQSPQPFVEINHQAQDGKAYYAMANTAGMTWQIDKDTVSRGQFENNGNLTNTFSTSFASISPVFTVYAIAVDLGTIQSTSAPVTWAVGYVRNPTIQYTTADGITQKLSPYFVTQYGTNIGQAIDAITAGFPDALQRAIAFDEAVIGNASKISPHYVDLVSLGLRQAIGSLDITVPTSSDGTPNASDVRIFMKDVGASSAFGRVSPVERIYAALPALLYVNSSLVRPLLAPLLDAQDFLTDTPYAAQDLGAAYPNATGARGSAQQGIEQTGNMLVALYAHARFSGDGSLISEHYNLTKRWADYLVANSLTPNNQMTADDESNANMTNLAIKGIIGVKAMAEISRALGQDVDAQQYDSHASALAGSWQSLATSVDQKHILGFYGNQQSWALMYNIYADRLLGTDVVSQTLLQGETSFYQELLQSSRPYGIPLDTAIGEVTTWQMFTAAIVQDDNVRNSLIDGVWARANDNLTAGTFPDAYDASTGAIQSGTGGPAAGGMYSLLALNLYNKTISASPLNVPGGPGSGGQSGSGDGNAAKNGKTSVGAIVGGVVGGIGALALVGLGVFLFLRKRRRHDILEEDEKIEGMQDPHRPTLSPYMYSPANPGPLSFGPPQAPMDSGTFGHPNASSQEMIGSNSLLVPELARDPLVSRQSSKERERERNTRLQYAASASGSSNTGTASSRDPLSPGRTQFSSSGSRSGASGTTGTSLSPTDVLGLRAEVENLRRVMQEIRADRLEPPPEYAG